jgi:hypothetical protein
MAFNAAKDLVYSMNGGNMSSGGYRISKILNNGKSKKKGKQTQGGGGYSNIFKEDSGIPIGLLLLQRLHFEDDNGDIEMNRINKDKKYDADHTNMNENENKKLVYANIMTESDDDGRDHDIELVIMPSGSGIVNPIEISSNEIDDKLYDSLVQSASDPVTKLVLTPLRKANATKKQNFVKHKDIEKIFQKRRTRSKRRH